MVDIKKISMSVGLGFLLIGSSAFGALEFTPPDVLSSDGVISGTGSASKVKLIGMGNGLMVSVYGDSLAESSDVYDLKEDGVRKARDIFVRTCMPSALNNQCAAQEDWSEPVNISNTALQTSASSRWQRDENGILLNDPAPFFGDSEKPNIYNAGSFAVVTWIDKYCPGGEQRIVSYYERNGLSVPFSCVYESHIDFAHPETGWITNRLTNGERDAKQDVSKGVSSAAKKGQWVITWQEDPQGLQIGGGDGPGDGASGAGVAHGTDIWYSYTEDLNATPFSTPIRLTDNYTHDSDGGNANPIYDNNGTIEITQLESGIAGASRANTAVVGLSTAELAADVASPTAIVTYEETKGTGGLDNGKYVRYHAFPFNSPDVNSSGAIISDPAENSRRVRFVTQTNPGANGMRMGIFWRQGNPVEGGPGDIMVRLGKKTADADSTGLRAEDMVPTVDLNARTSDYAEAILLKNEPAYNISSNTIPWSPIGGVDAVSTNTLADTTDKNEYEDARAHRAVIRGDNFHIGYSYTKDWAVATTTDLENYNFWARRYDSLSNTWTNAKNLSNITDKKWHVKEPRLVGMPGNGPGCLTPSDPTTITNPENCQDKNVLLVAWGVESNVYDHIGGSVEGDIYYTRTRDKGETYNGISVVEGIGTSNRYECQLRSTPAGNIVTTVWNENNNDKGGTYAMLSVSTSEDEGDTGITLPLVDSVDTIEETPVVASSSDGGSCSYNPASKSIDMTILLMLAVGLIYPFRRRFLK